MANERILVVEDEKDIFELIRFNLAREGYVVTGATSGEKALKQISVELPDLVVLDLMLPGIDGLSVAKKIKNNPETEGLPIVMLTAKTEDSDIVSGLEIGADDYITKPFSPRVLIARIRAVLRRKIDRKDGDNSMIRVHNLEIHSGRREVKVSGKPVELTYSEFCILSFLANKPGWVFTRYQIVDAIRGDDYPVTDRSVDVQIVGLRKKLGSAGKYIETVRGVGYRFKQ
jgi:two-component system phosphate regulon response regulator PhoB